LSDTNLAPGAGAEAIVPVPAATPTETHQPIDVSDAARALSNWRKTKNEAKPEVSQEPGAEEATPAPESAEEADAAPPQEATGETQEGDPAAEPPLDLPRSWTKDQTEHWNKLDRATQEFLLEHDRKASDAVRRSQNEAAEIRKAVEAEQKRAEQVRQEYESRLPVLLQTLQAQQAGEFADIKTQSDVMRMATEEPARYLRWDAYNKQLGAVQQQVQEAQQRQQQDQLQHFTKWSEEQDKLFAEKEPDILDPVKAPKLKEAAISELRNSGFTDNELASLWNGVFRDARVQLLINDAVKYRNAKQSVAKPAPKPIPPVHRPGTAPNKGAQQQAQIAAAAQKLTSARGVDAAKAGAELLRLQRQNAR
jgi:hypothetical protein